MQSTNRASIKAELGHGAQSTPTFGEVVECFCTT